MSSDGGGDTGGSDPTAASSAPGDTSLSDTGDSTGHDDDDSADSGAESTGMGSSDGGDGGKTGEQVYFVYVTTEAFAFPEDDPGLTCLLSEPGDAALRCEGDQRFPLLWTVDDTFADALSILQPLEVFGIFSDGSQHLRANPVAMLMGLDVSLADGDVNVDLGDTFWTGANGIDCSGWSDTTMGFGAIGVSNGVGGEWYAGGDAFCGEPLPILCGCLSVEDPFP